MNMVSAKSVLLLINLQKAIDHPSWGTRNNPDAEENIARLLALWRETARPIMHVRHVSREPNSMFRPGQEGVEFKSIALPLAGEAVITKSVANAFIGTNLEDWLRERQIASVVIVGVITNNSVEATARMAGDLGFDTIVVADATFTFGKADYEGRKRTAEEVHAMSLANLSGEYARIVTTEDVLRAEPA